MPTDVSKSLLTKTKGEPLDVQVWTNAKGEPTSFLTEEGVGANVAHFNVQKHVDFIAYNLLENVYILVKTRNNVWTAYKKVKG